MGGKQSGHNDISPTKLNSIHHKVVINTNRVEGIDSTDYNTSCNCEMRWVLGHAVRYTSGKLKFLPHTTKILLLEKNYVTRDYH